jgi:hypothetical protein
MKDYVELLLFYNDRLCKHSLAPLSRSAVVSSRNTEYLGHKPRRERGDLAEARLFAFLRGPIWYGAYQYRSSHELRDTDPLQHVAV